MSSHNQHVVVLGGGITGLSAAFYLARKHPTVQITLVEKSSRFGGWVRSERVEVCDSHGNRARVLLRSRSTNDSTKCQIHLRTGAYFLHYSPVLRLRWYNRYIFWTCVLRSFVRLARRLLRRIGSCMLLIFRKNYSRCHLVFSRFLPSHWVVSCSDPYLPNRSHPLTVHVHERIILLPSPLHRTPPQQQIQTQQKKKLWMMMMSPSTHSSQGGSEKRSRAR